MNLLLQVRPGKEKGRGTKCRNTCGRHLWMFPKVLREEFRRNPQLFLANQLMMSVQFFKNFDR